MLWRWLWSFSRGVRPAGGGGGAAVGLPCPRPVAPIRPREGDSAHSDGRWHGRYRQYKAYGCGKLSHFYCPLDAFTWGALAVLAVELAKQVRWLCYLQPDGGNGGICHLEGQLSVLPQHQHAGKIPKCSLYDSEQTQAVSSYIKRAESMDSHKFTPKRSESPIPIPEVPESL